MPFGAIYGALFFVLLAISMIAAAVGSSGPAAIARGFLALLALALGWGLLRRQVWARWGGALAALLLAALSASSLLPVSTAGGLLVLFGSLLTAMFLLVPAFGDPRRGAAQAGRRRSGADRLAGLAAVAGAAGLLVALAYGVPRGEGADGAGPAPLRRIGLSPRWSDFESGLERARSEGKPLLVNFVTNWCGFCRKMDRTTWKHPTVVERLGELVTVRVDAEDPEPGRELSGRELAARYGVTGYPTIILLDGGGGVISRTGGYQQPRQFLTWLEAGLGRVARAGPAPGL